MSRHLRKNGKGVHVSSHSISNTGWTSYPGNNDTLEPLSIFLNYPHIKEFECLYPNKARPIEAELKAATAENKKDGSIVKEAKKYSVNKTPNEERTTLTRSARPSAAIAMESVLSRRRHHVFPANLTI
jgi:hypothetical protein